MKKYNITSVGNEKIKYLKKLGVKRFREERGEFLAENIKIIYDALISGIKPVSVFITDELLQSGNEMVDHVAEQVEDLFVISKNVNKAFSSFATVSGIAAVFKVNEKNIDLDSKIVYLNGISDPGNLGTILRTSLAFGIKNIVVDEDCADIYNPKTIHAAKDSIFKMNIAHDKSMKVLNEIKSKMKIYATSLEKGIDVKDLPFVDKCAVVFGNESNGVSKEILDLSDDFIKINMSGEIESLNVAISAGIVLYGMR